MDKSCDSDVDVFCGHFGVEKEVTEFVKKMQVEVDVEVEVEQVVHEPDLPSFPSWEETVRSPSPTSSSNRSWGPHSLKQLLAPYFPNQTVRNLFFSVESITIKLIPYII